MTESQVHVALDFFLHLVEPFTRPQAWPRPLEKVEALSKGRVRLSIRGDRVPAAGGQRAGQKATSETQGPLSGVYHLAYTYWMEQGQHWKNTPGAIEFVMERMEKQ